ncbi:phosphoribosyltransferase [uncultured Ferrovibrio sp.]|uniref:phosphoribosyltransferase n=1 Tax=uncultured Ferrovibrio sp. TaxID=1576913 RepID=UPI0026107C44|nr:phosphoribosyltransferase [uncultured Ferrovibrio sp.]
MYDLVTDQAIDKIRKIIKNGQPRIVAVHAQESQGKNKIPMAYAEVLAAILKTYTDPGIVQSVVADHTNAASFYHRMVSPPTFDGYVESGAEYFIVDDTCTAGGTLANLRGYIESRGGIVVGISTLALPTPNLEYDISLAQHTLARLKYRHPELDNLCRQEFNHGIECLTEGEAGHFYAAPSTDTIRNRLAEARRDLNISRNEEADAGTPCPTEEDYTGASHASEISNGG